MKSNYLILFFITAVLSSFTSNTQPIKPKQLLKKVDASLSEIQTVIYKIDYSNKHFSSKDTIQRVAVCSLFVDYTDKMNAYHILDVKLSEPKRYGHYQYDGIYTSAVTYHSDSIDKEKKKLIENTTKNNYVSITGTHISNYLLQDYFKEKNIFRQTRSLGGKLLIKKMEIEEITYLNETVYLLTVYAKNIKLPNYVQNAVNKYYIRKTDFLPVAYSFSGEFEGMKEYEYYEIDYIAINPDIPLEEFKVDTNVTEIKPKTIYEKLQKYGL